MAASVGEINNTNFSSEITDALRKYMIEKGMLIPNKFDDLNANTKLMSYQKVLQEYMTRVIENSDEASGFAIIHGLGSGKTFTAIIIAESTPRKVVVLSPKSLRVNFISELKKFIKKYALPESYAEMPEDMKKKARKRVDALIDLKYKFVSSNSGTSAQQLDDLIFDDFGALSDEGNNKKKNPLDDKLLIIDEAHNFTKACVNTDGANAGKILHTIMNANNLKRILLTGTPIVSNPFELSPFFNLLRGYMDKNGKVTGKKKGDALFTALPEDYDTFNEYFVDQETGLIKNKSLFQNRIVGLVSYFQGIRDESREILAELKPTEVKKIPMSEYQWRAYARARKGEQDEERIRAHSSSKFKKMHGKIPKRDTVSTFRVKSRQASNFVLPPRLQEKQLDSRQRKQMSAAEIDRYYEKLLAALSIEELTDQLPEYSPKMVAMLDQIEKSSGNVLVYSQFITMEGLGIFVRVLEANGWRNYNQTRQTGPRTFAVFGGTTSDQMREDIVKLFDDPGNPRGEMLKLILGTATMSEGLNLFGIRDVLIMEPYWHDMRIRQVIGRALRQYSHKFLNKEEREIAVSVFCSIEPKGIDGIDQLGEAETTDIYLYARAIENQKLLDSFLDAIRESAFDCQLNYEHNRDKVEGCRVCQATNKPLYIPDIVDQYLLELDNCIAEKTVIKKKFHTVEENGKVYKVDEQGKKYEKLKDGTYRKVATI